MSHQISIFYHALFELGDPPEVLPGAINIVREQMVQFKNSGLLDACSEFIVGINGEETSQQIASLVIPAKAKVVMHGLQCRNELRTILLLVEWAKTHPGWHVLYVHAKGATHSEDSHYGLNVSAPWRIGMMQDLVERWRGCVSELATHDIVASHWMWNLADGTQHIPAGNFLWITSNFVNRLPDIMLRDRLKVSGLDSVESRFEAEVHWGNGPRPKVYQCRPHGGGGVP